MPTYVITAPDGKEYEIDAPQGATQDQALAYFQQNWKPSATAAAPAPAYNVTDEFKRRSAASMARAESPALATAADVLAGMTSVPRGALNIVGQAFAGTKWGDQIFPTAAVNKGSTAYLAGEIADPTAMAIGGGVGTAAKFIPKLGQYGRNIAAGVGGGAAIGGLTDEGDATTGALAGGAISAALPVAGKVAGKGIDLLQGKGADIRTGRMLREAGANADMLRSAGPNLNVAQAMGGDNATAGLAALQDIAASRVPDTALSLQAKQEAARLARLKAETPDLAAATAARKEASDIAYGKAYASDKMRREAEQQVGESGLLGMLQPIKSPKLAPALQSLKRNPIIQAAEREAKLLAGADPTLPESVAKDPMSTLEGLHLMKIAIDNRFKSPNTPTALQKYSDSALGMTKERLLKAIDEVSPLYTQAREQFARMSPEVNQAQVMDELTNVLKRPGGGERVRPFLNVMEGGEVSLLRKANQTPRFGGISDVLTPSQMQARNTVAGELQRDLTLAEKAKAGTTVGKEILDKNLFVAHLPNLLRQDISLLNRAISWVGDKVNKSTLDKLSNVMYNPTEAAKVIETLPASERNVILRAMNDPAITGAVSGMLTGAAQ